MKEKDIPWENVYNMDEKGIQLGGGRKGTRQKFLFARGDKVRYKLQNASLQLVTVIEVVCADGTSNVMPGFVFAGARMHEDWVTVDKNIM